MTPEQQRALALARAQRKRAEAAQPQRSFGQMIKENVLGDNDPTTQNFGEKVGTFLNKAGESMTMGLIGDEASAAVEGLIPGVDRNERQQFYRDQESQFEQSNPGLALTADIGGAMVAPLGAIGAVGRSASALKRVAASSAASGGMGATYGFMEGEDGNRAQSAVDTGSLAAAAGAAVPIAGGALQKLLNARASSRTIKEAARGAPTTEEGFQQASTAYRAIDDAGLSIKPDVLQNRTSAIAQMLKEGGADPIITPNSARLQKVMSEAADGMNSVPVSEVERLRRISGNAAGANLQNKGDTRLATRAIGELDDFMSGLGQADVDFGDLEAVQSLLPKARELWAKSSRSQTIDDAISAGDDYLSGSASGIRNQFRRILRSDKMSRGFSEAEKKAMRRVINGSIPEQVILMAGSGLGRLAAAGVGFMGGPLGAIGGIALGVGARKLSDRIVIKNAETVRALVANGGLKSIPEANPNARIFMERLLRQGSAAAAQ